MAGEEVHLEPFGGLDVAHLGVAPLQLVQHRRLERVSEVRAAARVERANETRIRRIDLARIGVALALRIGRERHFAQQEGVHEMAEQRVDLIPRHAVALRFEVLGQAMHAEPSGGIAQAVPHQPAQRGHL